MRTGLSVALRMAAFLSCVNGVFAGLSFVSVRWTESPFSGFLAALVFLSALEFGRWYTVRSFRLSRDVSLRLTCLLGFAQGLGFGIWCASRFAHAGPVEMFSAFVAMIAFHEILSRGHRDSDT